MKQLWEKEDEYEQRWASGRIPTDIWKYVPQKLWSAVTDAFADSDGYWIWLADDYFAYDGGADCGTIHEYTVADLKEAVKTIRMIKGVEGR